MYDQPLRITPHCGDIDGPYAHALLGMSLPKFNFNVRFHYLALPSVQLPTM